MKRHFLISATAAAAALTLLLAGCSGAQGSSQSTGAAGTPVSGGVLNVGENSDEPTTLDPHALSDTNTTILLRPVFDTLVWETPKKTFEPDLASSWDISKDGLTYTFHLRKGVVFQDGSAWDAAGLKLNFEHILDPATKSPLAASYIAPYKDSTVLDKYTLEVHLSYPYSSFLNVLAQSYLSIISPKQIQDSPETIDTHPIGSGPFEFVKWVKGQYIQYKRYDKYNWAPPGSGHEGPAYLSGIKINFIAEDSVRFNAVGSGDVDIIENTPPQSVAQVKDNPDLRSASKERPGHPFAFWFNTTHTPFDEPKVRQAIVDAVDREQLVKTVSFGQWKTANGYITPVTPDYAANTATISYDPKKSAQLLDEAGWSQTDADGYRVKDGKELTATYIDSGVNPQTTQFAQLIQAAVKKIGVKVIIKQETATQASADSLAGNFDLSAGIWTTNTADVLWIQYSSQNITTAQRQGQNASRLSDAKLDDLIQKARETTDAKERSSLYEQAQARLVQLAPAIPLYIRPDLVTYNQKVNGVTFDDAYGALVFYDTWLSH
ncbi:ABC transporter substrate-binding protein [Rathayibacter sp. CAU 1779]